MPPAGSCLKMKFIPHVHETEGKLGVGEVPFPGPQILSKRIGFLVYLLKCSLLYFAAFSLTYNGAIRILSRNLKGAHDRFPSVWNHRVWNHAWHFVRARESAEKDEQRLPPLSSGQEKPEIPSPTTDLSDTS